MKLFLLPFLLLPTLSFAKKFVPSSFSANYVEKVKSVTGKNLESSGKIDYKYPGHIRFEVLRPEASRTLFVVNPEKAWIYQPAFAKGEKDQVTVQKSANLPLIKFLDSVQDGLDKSKLFTKKYERNNLILTFVQGMQKEMGIKEVLLHSSKNAKEINELKGFDAITLKYSNGKDTTIVLEDLKENVTFPPDHFIFKPSPNTKVISN